jgi:hypothetical protein
MDPPFSPVRSHYYMIRSASHRLDSITRAGRQVTNPDRHFFSRRGRNFCWRRIPRIRYRACRADDLGGDRRGTYLSQRKDSGVMGRRSPFATYGEAWRYCYDDKKAPSGLRLGALLVVASTLGFYAERPGCRGMGWPPGRGLSALDR